MLKHPILNNENIKYSNIPKIKWAYKPYPFQNILVSYSVQMFYDVDPKVKQITELAVPQYRNERSISQSL